MGSPKKSKTKPVNPNPDWQDRDIKLKWLAVFLVIVLVVTVVTMVAMRSLFARYETRIQDTSVPVSPLALERDLPEGVPVLQVTPADELVVYEASQQQILETYGWANKEMGVARIPIDRAIEMVAQKGLPTRETP